jgi:hypothetical protein
MIKDELTYSIIGCAIKVHNTLGNGFQKVISPFLRLTQWILPTNF